MTMTYLNFGGEGDFGFFASPTETALPPVYVDRPAIKIPRSARREYTDSELSTAASMLAKMRKRADVVDHLKQHPCPTVLDGDGVLDKVVERLLNLV